MKIAAGHRAKERSRRLLFVRLSKAKRTASIWGSAFISSPLSHSYQSFFNRPLSPPPPPSPSHQANIISSNKIEQQILLNRSATLVWPALATQLLPNPPKHLARRGTPHRRRRRRRRSRRSRRCPLWCPRRLPLLLLLRSRDSGRHGLHHRRQHLQCPSTFASHRRRGPSWAS